MRDFQLLQAKEKKKKKNKKKKARKKTVNGSITLP